MRTLFILAGIFGGAGIGGVIGAKTGTHAENQLSPQEKTELESALRKLGLPIPDDLEDPSQEWEESAQAEVESLDANEGKEAEQRIEDMMR
jgi:hypothetical protein